MALTKEIPHNTGTRPNYWRIESAHFYRETGKWEMLLSGFISAEARASGATPIYPPYKVSGNIGDNYKLLYGLLKQEFDGNPFSDAEDFVEDPWRNPPAHATLVETVADEPATEGESDASGNLP